MIINQNYSNQNFTSVIPMKILDNGILTRDEAIGRATMRALSKALKQTGIEKNAILDQFVKYDKDFTNYNGFINKDVPIHSTKQYSYLFTNKQAKDLEMYGKNIGLARRNVNAHRVCNADVFVDNSFQESVVLREARKADYKNLVNELISIIPNRIKEYFNPATKIYSGEPMELLVNVNSSGKKFKLEGISFEKINKTVNQPAAQVQNQLTQQAPKGFTEPQSKTFAEKMKQKCIQLSLF